jgi:hypothetical protein
VSAYLEEHRDRFGVEPVCSTLDVSASAYYQRATGERSARVIEDERLLAVIKETHEANYCAYGYRRTWIALTRAGEQVPRCRVQRLMATNGIQGAKRRGKPWRTTRPDPGAQRSPDLVNRDFTAERPNALWVTDFTYLRCWEGVVYFSFVIDVYSRMIVGWQLAGNMRTTLVLDALRTALGLREHGADVQLVHHSDAGSQYTSGDGLTTSRDSADGVDFVADGLISPENAAAARNGSAQAARTAWSRDERQRPASPISGSETYSLTETSRPTTQRPRNPPNPVSAEPGPPHQVGVGPGDRRELAAQEPGNGRRERVAEVRVLGAAAVARPPRGVDRERHQVGEPLDLLGARRGAALKRAEPPQIDWLTAACL